MATKKKAKGPKNKPVAKSEAASSSQKNYMTPSGVREFIGEVQAEFTKIVWPEKKVTAGLTGFVIILVVIISIYLGSVDLLLGKLVSMVLK